MMISLAMEPRTKGAVCANGVGSYNEVSEPTMQAMVSSSPVQFKEILTINIEEGRPIGWRSLSSAGLLSLTSLAPNSFQ